MFTGTWYALCVSVIISSFPLNAHHGGSGGILQSVTVFEDSLFVKDRPDARQEKKMESQ